MGIAINRSLLQEIRAALIAAVVCEDGLDGAEAGDLVQRINVTLGLDANDFIDPDCPNCDGTGSWLTKQRRCGVCWNWRGNEVWEHHAI